MTRTAPKVSIIIPSRTQPRQGAFLERALASIRAQTVFSGTEIEALIGIDAGAAPPKFSAAGFGVRAIMSGGNSQAAALNAAAAQASGAYLAFLEDDDQWHPNYLELSLETSGLAPFVSSTQLEVDERDNVLYIQDFPTPSGWLMTSALWREVGGFNEEYRWHLDNEWLGRLAERGVPRMHMVECTAPVQPSIIETTRPLLANVLRNAGGNLRLARHHIAMPLILRAVHDQSGMAQIARGDEAGARSERERAQLIARFGRVPC